MPRRRSSTAPRSMESVLVERIERLQKRVNVMMQAKMSSVQTFDPRLMPDSHQGEFGIDVRSGHLARYHDGRWNEGMPWCFGYNDLTGTNFTSQFVMPQVDNMATNNPEIFSFTPYVAGMPLNAPEWNKGSIIIKEPGNYLQETHLMFGNTNWPNNGTTFNHQPYGWMVTPTVFYPSGIAGYNATESFLGNPGWRQSPQTGGSPYKIGNRAMGSRYRFPLWGAQRLDPLGEPPRYGNRMRTADQVASLIHGRWSGGTTGTSFPLGAVGTIIFQLSPDYPAYTQRDF